MSQTTEGGASEGVEKVGFSFMTTEEVRRHSVLKITNPVLLDAVGRPTPGGLYDPAMGPFDEHSQCKSCGQRSFHCPGHCGHIDLVSPAYNPLAFNMLYNLLQRICFFCFHFQASREEVDKCVSQLERIAKGDVIGARRLDAASSADLINLEDSEGSHVSFDNVYHGAEDHSERIKQPPWDTFQFTEAMSVLNILLKPRSSKCGNCEARNPKVKKPTFGWLHLGGLSGAKTHANIIKGHRLDGFLAGGAEERSSSEVVNANDPSRKDDIETAETESFLAVSDGKNSPLGKKPSDEVGGVYQELMKQNAAFSGPLLPSEVRDILKRLWDNEAPICSFICNLQREQHNTMAKIAGHSMFFLESILVPPIKFRPVAKGGDSVMEHPHTVLLGKVLQSNIALANAHINKAEHFKIVNRWMDLQQSINVLYDSKTTVGQSQRAGASGICQLLEKKEGIFRQKMMGKRVNFACRSVISPDPYLAVNEIGIPPYFALRLTYPERVTPWNVAKLRDAIVNGPEIHPGAISYTDKVSTVKLPSSKKMRIAISRKLPSSRGVVTHLGKNSEHEFEGKVVYRHLQDGDIVLVNRQPTLHKPSIMAHVVRVLKGEKTLRMHYANCSSYNADFDGDEMNVHFPQDEISRAEAYNIVNANEQYIVPTRGDTVRGLIQDHIGSAVILTMKDTFLTYDEFNQLLYGSGVFTTGTSSFSSNYSSKISVVDSEGIIQPVLPTIWKPKPLWTGKQVITALLNHLTKGCAPCTIQKEMKIPKQYFPSETYEIQQSENDEKKVDNCLLVWKNELVCGVIDKAQFGQFGLVHTVQELYGSNSAGLLLSALSRLFTIFLQMHGFTCGVEDLIILPHFDVRRKEELEGEDGGEDVHCEFVNFKRGQIGPLELQLEIEKVICRDREAATASLDMKMKNKLTKKASQISKELLLKGLLKPFPKNCISLMTISGAKGSTVNFQQISSYLGQQELEGKRVPRMVSGKTLPCFPPWDFTSRAGGYITDRFLSGLRPQEYYFHCMAGREGLVDTAVKTSRSGYLQRCLIKNLESMKVCYDYTVRDADGSIVQFYYGEDGVDVHQTSFLKNLKALVHNQETVRQKYKNERDFNAYIVELPDGLKRKAEGFLKGVNKDAQTDFLKLLTQKYLSSLAPSGEPVGVIAAQSVGEPSTQMTLNTFHLAGRGEMNLTLGIPRLQEILMTAANVIKTPVLTCPFLQFKSVDDAKSLVAKVKKITVADIIESMEVHLLPLSVHNNEIQRIFKLMMTFKRHEFVSLEDCEKTLRHAFLRELEDAIANHVALLSKISGIKNFTSKPQSKENEMDEDASATTSHGEGNDGNDDGDEDGDDNDDMAEDLGSDAQKRKQQATDEMDYEDISEDETSSDDEQGKDGQLNDEVGPREEKETSGVDEEYASEMQNDNGEMSKPKSGKKKAKSTFKKRKYSEENIYGTKETDRSIYVDVKGQNFEVHFRFNKEPHILLAQIAQKTAKKVYIKSSGKLSQCKMVEHDVSENTVIWDADKVDKKINAKKQVKANEDELLPYWALKAAGVDFTAFWEMQDDLDITRIYSNSIQAMLETFGVEAARAAIIREVKNVFGIYGVEIDFRHLSLIADYMTHTGGYRPMSRHGSIAESLSPLAKMSFETASKFIVEAASHGMSDNLETPSSRICLGLPVKMGTGCFDLMQQLNV